MGTMPDGKRREMKFALGINLTVRRCDLDREVRRLTLEYEGQPENRVEFSSVPLASALFFALTPVPYQGYPDPVLRLRALDLGGDEKYTCTMTIQMLMNPQGYQDEHIALEGNGKYLDDPLSVLDPTRTLGIGPLSHRRDMPIDSILHYARIDITVPPIDIQCMGASKALKTFAVVHTPDKLVASYIERPRINQPNRRLRRAIQYAHEQKGRTLPGRMSLLQACSMKLVNNLPPRTIELGPPKKMEMNREHVEIENGTFSNDSTPSELVEVDKVIQVTTNMGGNTDESTKNNVPALTDALSSRKRKGGIVRSRSFESVLRKSTKKANDRVRTLEQLDLELAKHGEKIR